MKFLILTLIVLSGCATNFSRTEGTRIYQVDSYGTVLYHKQHEIVIKDKIYQVDKYGTILYHKPAKKIAEK